MSRTAPYLVLFATLLALIFWLRPVPDETGQSVTNPSQQSSRSASKRTDGVPLGDRARSGGRMENSSRWPEPSSYTRSEERTPRPSQGHSRSPPPEDSGESRTNAGRAHDLPPGMSTADIPEIYSGREADYLAKLAGVRDRRTPEDDGGRALPVRFTAIAPDTETGAVGTQDAFSPATGRIYGVFSCDDERFRDVERMLVKWFSPEEGNVWFEYVGIRPDAPFNYVWWESVEWLPGPYRVELYDLLDEPTVLAAGTFRVEEGMESIGGLTVSPADEPFTVTDFLVDEAVHARLPYRVSARIPIRLKATKMETGEVSFDRSFDLLPGETLLRVPLKGREPTWPPGTYDLKALDRNGTLRGSVRFVVN